MRIHFKDTRRPARVAKALRSAFAAHGFKLGLAGAQDACARLYGYATYHELKASCGRHPPSAWDEDCTPSLVADRKAWQVASLVASGLPEVAARRFVEENRPTGTSRSGKAADPAVRDADGVMERLLRRAVGAGATEIRFEATRDGYAAFLHRQDGRELTHMGTTAEYGIVVSQLKDRSRMDLAERQAGQVGGFQIDHSGRFVDLYVATSPSPHGECVLVRVLDPERSPSTLEDIGPRAAERWRQGISRRNGLCLIVGQTGSDRTVTLNASVRELDRFGKKIYTAEDPVEYRIPYVGQVSMNSGVGYGFAQAIRNFMRQDPDVMVLGEIRDAEGAENVVRSSETGHMVLATMDAPGAREAVDRLAAYGIEPFRLRFVLRSVLVLHSEVPGRHDGECYLFRSHSDVDRFLAGAGRPTPLRDVPPDVMDDAIALMRAGEVTARALLRLFGEAFRKRMVELGLSLDDFGVA